MKPEWNAVLWMTCELCRSQEDTHFEKLGSKLVIPFQAISDVGAQIKSQIKTSESFLCETPPSHMSFKKSFKHTLPFIIDFLKICS